MQKNIFGTKKWFCAYIFLSILTCSYMSTVSPGNDFQVYFNAGKLITQFQNPWDVAGNPNALYLHGPLSSIWIAGFSFLPYIYSLTILRILTLTLIPIALWMLFEILNIKLNAKLNLWNLSLIMLFSSPVRSILNYGRFEILVFFIFILVIYLLKKHLPSNSEFILCGFLVGLIVDYKPQVFLLPCLILIWKYPKFKFFLGIILSVLVGSIFSTFLTSNFPFFSWINILHLRGKDTSASEPLGLFSIYYGFGISPFLSVGIGLLLIIIISFLLFKGFTPTKIQSLKIFFFIYLFFFPLLHAQDLIWVPTILLVSLAIDSDLTFTPIFLLALGSTLTWSDSYLLDTLLLIPISFWLYRNTSMMTLLRRFGLIVVLMLPNFLFHTVAYFFPSPANGGLRHSLVLFNVLASIGILLRQERITDKTQI